MNLLVVATFSHGTRIEAVLPDDEDTQRTIESLESQGIFVETSPTDQAQRGATVVHYANLT